MQLSLPCGGARGPVGLRLATDGGAVFGPRIACPALRRLSNAHTSHGDPISIRCPLQPGTRVCTKESAQLRESFHNMAKILAEAPDGDVLKVAKMFRGNVHKVAELVHEAKVALAPESMNMASRQNRDKEAMNFSLEIWWNQVQLDINTFLTAREQTDGTEPETPAPPPMGMCPCAMCRAL